MLVDSPLLNLATVLLAGLVGGELISRLRLPKVTGWIGTGIALRVFALPGLTPDALPRFAPLTEFVLGFIAFTVGATLHFASLRNAGPRLLLLVLCEAVFLPLVVTSTLMLVGGLGSSAALLLAAIAIAGAPGTTVLVVNEARARGVLSRTLIAAVGLIDMVAVGTFVFVSDLVRNQNAGLSTGFVAVGVEFGLAGGIGLGCAVAVLALSRTVVSPSSIGPMMVAVILGAWGVGQAIGASSILACTVAGIAISNLRHDTARSAEAYLQPFGGVLFAGFYTLAGMRLDFAQVIPVIGLVALYFVARLAGKALSAYVAMSLAGTTNTIRHYLGLALLPHGGVAVGLIFFVQADPGLAYLAPSVVAIGLATLAVNQLIGPSATRFALIQAGEVAKDRPRLLDFLTEDRIVVNISGKTKEAVIEQLVDRLYNTTARPELSRDQFFARVMAREHDESTCLGDGFMIPHTMLDEGNDVRGVLGLSADGLDLGAYDGRKVHAVVLMATPQNDRQRHLQILAAFASAITRNVTLREQLYAARSAAHAYEILHAEDSEDLNYFLDEAIQHAGV